MRNKNHYEVDSVQILILFVNDNDPSYIVVGKNKSRCFK